MPKQPISPQPLFETHFTAGSRTYTIGVHSSQSNDRYLRLTETTNIKGGKPRVSHLLLFSESIHEFKRAFDEALAYCESASNALRSAEIVDSLRNAGEPWTHEADEELLMLHANKWTARQLANRYQRSKGAITSRLRHLGFKAYGAKQSVEASLEAKTTNSRPLL